jgi:hypothetical protein
MGGYLMTLEGLIKRRYAKKKLFLTKQFNARNNSNNFAQKSRQKELVNKNEQIFVFLIRYGQF